MILKSLKIERVMWGERTGELDGEVTFMSPKGEIKAILTDAQLPGIIELCAEALVKSAQEASAVMTAAIIIEKKPKEIAHGR